MGHDYEDIAYDVQDRVAVITLQRPERLNAWTPAMERSIQRALHAAAEDDGVRAIVVTGAGRGFCAGADMEVLETILEGAADAQQSAIRPGNAAPALASGLGPDVSEHYRGPFGYLMTVQKPILAAINGSCAGIGLVFALFCDLRFASEEAKFTTAFASRGLIAEHGVSWLLPKLVGPMRALDLLLSARVIKGREAAELGLVNRAYPPEQLLPEVMAYARKLADTVSPRSLGVIKAQVWKAQFQDLEAAVKTAEAEMAKSFASADFKEGVAHFLEKRPPRFTGR